MRMNIYAEEMADRVELVAKEGVIGADGAPTTFYGIRFYLASPPELHTTEHDTSAITFWFQSNGEDAVAMRNRLTCGVYAVDDALALMGTIQAAQGSAHNASVSVVEQ